MNEVNLLDQMPQPEYRLVGNRTIHNRITASYRGREFFDGDRADGYGGMVDDGRWGDVADRMIEHYRLSRGSRVMQIHCEKGYLLNELEGREMRVLGIEPSAYARRHCGVDTKPRPEANTDFDLVIAIGVVYTGNLADAIQHLREIERRGFNAFVTLGAYETEDDLRLLRQWTLLGTTILKPDEWREVMRHAGYTGDYSFVTAKTLRLRDA